MAPRLDFEFIYDDEPSVSVRMYSPETDGILDTQAQIDTGADISLFDESLARDLGLDLSRAPRILLGGLGGRTQVRLAEIELRLLGLPDLSLTLNVAFAAEQDPSIGNLIGLDVMEHFDFALSHANHTGYFGVAERPR